jgi:hypothetical protein
MELLTNDYYFITFQALKNAFKNELSYYTIAVYKVV